MGIFRLEGEQGGRNGEGVGKRWLEDLAGWEHREGGNERMSRCDNLITAFFLRLITAV